MFIDIKTKADIFTIQKGCFISKLPNSNKIILKKPYDVLSQTKITTKILF